MDLHMSMFRAPYINIIEMCMSAVLKKSERDGRDLGNISTQRGPANAG